MGGVIGIGGNPQPGTAGHGLVAQPVDEGGDLGGGVEALEQFGGGEAGCDSGAHEATGLSAAAGKGSSSKPAVFL